MNIGCRCTVFLGITRAVSPILYPLHYSITITICCLALLLDIAIGFFATFNFVGVQKWNDASQPQLVSVSCLSDTLVHVFFPRRCYFVRFIYVIYVGFFPSTVCHWARDTFVNIERSHCLVSMSVSQLPGRFLITFEHVDSVHNDIISIIGASAKLKNFEEIMTHETISQWFWDEKQRSSARVSCHFNCNSFYMAGEFRGVTIKIGHESKRD